ncbi:MAG TPA: hypothetical protein VK619_06000 [Pyrinomonadaceae bacterium]|nr:hypothetical protein [Pyrinomonadaceae bacterium]
MQFLSAHWWKILASLVPIVIAAVGWHLNNCLIDKRECVQKLRQAYFQHRAADEKFDQSLSTFYAEVKSFLKYLDQENVDLARVEQYQQQLDALAKIANDDCNNSKNAFYQLAASKAETERYYQIPELDYVLDISHKCASISAVAGGAGMPDAKKLATDRTFKNTFLEQQRPFVEEADDLLRIQPENFREYINSMEAVLQKIETRNSNLSGSIWDCLSLPFTGSKKLE